jgi:hypothetical protein
MGPQNEAQNETHCAKVFKMFFDELVELIIREKYTYAAQKIQARSFILLLSRMRDWKPVTTDEVYVALALSMLMGIIQKPTQLSFFKKLYFGDIKFLALLFLWIGLNQSANFLISALAQFVNSKLCGNMPRKFRPDQNRTF